MSRGQKQRTIENFPKMNDRKRRRILRRRKAKIDKLVNSIRNVEKAFQKMTSSMLEFGESCRAFINSVNATYNNELGKFVSASRNSNIST